MMTGTRKFSLGQVVATPGALEPLEEAEQTPLELVYRHSHSDFGEELREEDRQLNEQALVDGSRLLSAYRLKSGVKLWIITEAADENGKRAATTLLLPEEY